MDIVSVKDVDVRGRRVLLRVDFNVPIASDGSIADDTRIREGLPTIEYLRSQGARTVVMSHLGRPGGRTSHRFSLEPVARRLGQLLKAKVPLVEDIQSDGARASVEALGEGDVLVLENLRFYPGEEADDAAFSGYLASLGQIFVNDAFGTAHRAHASTHGVAAFLPAVAGLLMHREVTTLGQLRERPEAPYVAVLGGAKISDKLSVCRRLLDKVDVLILGGGLANTFLLAMGHSVGNSLVEPDMVPEVRGLIAESNRKNVDLLMPLDVLVASTISPSASTQVVDSGSVPRGWSIVDIGTRTATRYTSRISSAKTAFWNGPMGVMEIPAFSRGSEAIARAMAELRGGRTVVGGGESVEMLSRLGLADKVDHVSTGGGAALQFLAGDELPALSVLERAGSRNRRPWVGGNWKMSVAGEQVTGLARDIGAGLGDGDVDVVLFPAHTQIGSAAGELAESPVMVGGQDCHWETAGAYTGSVSGGMLGDAGASWTLVGHSECRRYLGDDDARVARKLRAALAAGLRSVLCVGEDDRSGPDGGWRTVEAQLRRALGDLGDIFEDDHPWGDRLVVAYEPVWAIGTGEAAEPATVGETTARIRGELARIFDPWAAAGIRVVYGGSVDAGNAGDFLALPSVDGVLVGGASTSADSFLGIVDAVAGAPGKRGE